MTQLDDRLVDAAEILVVPNNKLKDKLVPVLPRTVPEKLTEFATCIESIGALNVTVNGARPWVVVVVVANVVVE